MRSGLHQNLGDLTSGGERLELVGGANAAYPFVVQVPTKLSAEEEELIRKLAWLKNQSVVEKGLLKDFWDRLTS